MILTSGFAAILIILYLVLSGLNFAAAESTDNQSETQSNGDKLPTAYVTTVALSDMKTVYLDLFGKVESVNNIKIIPTTSGELKRILVNEGEYVREGDPLFIIGGTNGSEHISSMQYDIAKVSFDSAAKGLKSAKAGNELAIDTAALQLQNAVNQNIAAYIDRDSLSENIMATNRALSILNDTLNETHRKNEMDLQTAQDGIDDLKYAINDLENQKADLMDDGEDYSQTDSQLDELYDQLDTAKKGLEQLLIGIRLSENQIIAQMQQTQSQERALNLNRDSVNYKLGLDGESSDPLKLAEKGYDAAIVQADAALTQAQSAYNLAAINLDMAKVQLDALTVLAPISGIVSSINIDEGDLVGPQSLLANIVNATHFELKVGVDADSADRIDPSKPAEINIGGQTYKGVIKSISPVTDAQSGLVNIIVSLPRITFRDGERLNVRVPISTEISGGSSLFIPLDAVIIGTQESFVFTIEDGKAAKKIVNLGEVSGDLVQAEGLTPNCVIILEGARELTEGQPVEIIQ